MAEFPNFWAEYPDAQVIEPFIKLRNKRGDEISSNLMWYIRLLNDPEHEYISKIPNIREVVVQNHRDVEQGIEVKKDKKSQREKILADYFGVKNTDTSSTLFKDAAQWYVEYWMPPTKRMLNSLQNRLFEAAKVADEFRVHTMEDIITSADAVEAYQNFKRLYDEAVANFNEDKKKKVVGFGKKQVSAAMSGELFKTNGTK